MKRALKAISLIVMTACLPASGLGQGQSQPNASPAARRQKEAAAKSSSTPGQIAKFTGPGLVGDSNITEDDSGKIGIGTTAPTSPLTVNGVIETTGAGGGIKFADGTLQMTAGLTSLFRDNTLKGNGTQASPLGVASPLRLFGPAPAEVLFVGNSSESGTGIAASGGPDGGEAVRAEGADNFSSQHFAGIGMRVFGGRNQIGSGGQGAQVFGGQGALTGGSGLVATGGLGGSGNGGEGVRVQGGTGRVWPPGLISSTRLGENPSERIHPSRRAVALAQSRRSNDRSQLSCRRAR